MKFYISWSRCDPVYSYYFNSTNMLVSPTSLYKNKSIVDKWAYMPDSLMIDSGSFFYLSKNEDLPLQREILDQQITILKNIKIPAIICHLDNPISPSNYSHRKTFIAIEKTMGNAYEFKKLFDRRGLYKYKNLKTLGVIQGNNKSTIQHCARELKNIGFHYYGLGSVAPLYSSEEIINRIKYVLEIIPGNKLHIFGISRLDIMKNLIKLNVHSIDSSRPAMAAIYKGIFYSNPFRTYGISKAENSKSYSLTLKNPLDCDCPVCQENPNLLFELYGAKAVNARALHNYYHLTKSLLKQANLEVIKKFV